ncbi:hypothetical protein ACH4S8_34345 [Streptomyces sp. NPDC021080]|uniref:hypothetical protein n=1 Tax=Streptomyces sp. NPDC021080 TaxID=3365110 RepID=UPI0037B4163F
MLHSRRRSKALLGSLLGILVVTVSGCSSKDEAVSPEEVRRLADSPQAVTARQDAEERLRFDVSAYAEQTRLELGLISLRDDCHGGQATQLFDPDGYDPYKIKCSLRMTAYFGADPKRMGDTLDSILDKGDMTDSHVAFGHDYYRDHLIAYYRGKGPNPIGADADEPTLLTGGPGQTLYWDPVRHDGRSHVTIAEPAPCAHPDPPVTRCVMEPRSTSVAAVRKRYGMVFQLDLAPADYYEVAKSGHS